jgi:hypothetical protein
MRFTRGRKGYTLVEMLIVISGLAVVFGLSVGMIHMLLRLDRGSRSRLGEKASISRLAREFRRDAHAAISARSVDADGRRGVELELGGGRKVTYADDASKLVRYETAGADPARREIYRLPSRGRPEVRLDEGRGETWVTVTLPPDSNAKEIAPARPVVIEARVGKHARLAAPGEASR